MSMFQKQSMAVNVRMTPAQHQKIQEAAKRAGIPMKEYMLIATLRNIDDVAEWAAQQQGDDPYDAF